VTDTFVTALLLGGRRCLVVGSGDEAVRRATNLADAGAHVAVVANAPNASLAHLARERGMELLERAFRDEDLDGAWLVVQADRDTALAARLGAACRLEGSLSVPSLSDPLDD
jgi:siroheme synthase-like protein